MVINLNYSFTGIDKSLIMLSFSLVCFFYCLSIFFLYESWSKIMCQNTHFWFLLETANYKTNYELAQGLLPKGTCFWPSGGVHPPPSPLPPPLAHVWLKLFYSRKLISTEWRVKTFWQKDAPLIQLAVAATVASWVWMTHQPDETKSG